MKTLIIGRYYLYYNARFKEDILALIFENQKTELLLECKYFVYKWLDWE